MEVKCRHCGHQQQVDDNLFGNREKVDLTCPECGKSFQIVNPMLATFRASTTRRTVSPVTSQVTDDGRVLRLPEGQEISLRVLEGNEKGTVYPINKPRMTIGRENADIVVKDRLSSRLHCALEVADQDIRLLDLGSTNGTLINNEFIDTATLSNGSIFQVGKHSFQLVIAPRGT